jgi:hypothetical protein
MSKLTLSTSMIDTTHDEFVIGWNWGSESKKLDEALGINFYHTGTPSTSVISTASQVWWGDSSRFIHHPYPTFSGYNYPATTQAAAIHYEPYFDVNITNSFYGHNNDSTGASFGFLTKHPDFTSLQDSFHLFKMTKAQLSGDSALVLSDPWPDNELYDMRHNISSGIAPHDSMNGDRWYLSLRIKPLETIRPLDNDTLLCIKLPYTAQDKYESLGVIVDSLAYGHIRFDSIADPSTTSTSFDTLYSNRDTPEFLGVARKLIGVNTAVTDRVYITSKMLYYSAGSLSEYVTLSFHFRTNDEIGHPNYSNYKLKNLRDGNINISDQYPRITNLGIDVTYYGNKDVAIDWIRVETPHYRNLSRGHYDNEILRNVDSTLNIIHTARPDISLYKIFGIDEFWTCNNASQRYANKLLGGLVTSEVQQVSQVLPGHYYNSTGIDTYWAGITSLIQSESASPLVKRTFKPLDANPNEYAMLLPDQRAGYWNGYYGKEYWDIGRQNSSVLFRDTLGSTYETFISRGGENWLNDGALASDHTLYEHLWEYAHTENLFDLPFGSDSVYYTREIEGLLWHNEYMLKKNWYDHQSLLYGGNDFWAQLWLQVPLTLYPDTDDIINSNGRAMTEEELRRQQWTYTILGAKGIMYYYGATDFKWNDPAVEDYYIGESGLSRIDNLTLNIGYQNSLPTGQALLDSDLLGGDFIVPNDVFVLGGQNFWDYISDDIDTLTLNLQKERFYMGTRTLRRQVKKFSEEISATEHKLLPLELAAWFGHGFSKLYSQKPGYEPDLLRKFIQYDSIKSRRIFTPSADGNHNFSPDFESLDSTFYDVTLLAGIYPIDQPLVEEFYIGIQNRRTDPLIFLQVPSSSPYDGELQYYTGAEFEDRVLSGGGDLFGVNHSSKWWRDQWWKKLGVRQFHIPLNINGGQKIHFDNDDFTQYEVQELHIGTDLDTVWWKHPDLSHNIDTVIGRKGSIVVNMLPGEGKLLRVRKIHNNTKQISGLLTNQNQRKLIVYPSNDSLIGLGETGDSVRYHATYHRKNNITDRLEVFYRRSEIVHRSNTSEIIPWEDHEYLISDTISVRSSLSPPEANLDCAYPSIVVRYDSLNSESKVYIVFQCEDGEHIAGYNTATGMFTNAIAENTFSANQQSVLPKTETDYSLLLDRVVVKNDTKELVVDTFDYGHPVINASAYGNYYAYSDKNNGIKIGYKSPSSEIFDTLKKSNIVGLGSNYHPSLNTYSRIHYNENDCALAWAFGTPGGTDIAYTRLFIDEHGMIDYHVAPDTCSGFWQDPAIDHILGDKALSIRPYYETVRHDFPMIYRGIENKAERLLGWPDEWNKNQRMDFIYWTSYSTDPMINNSIISYIGIQNEDTLDFNGISRPTCHIPLGTSIIVSPNYALGDQLSVAQGTMSQIVTGSDTIYSNYEQALYQDSLARTIVLDFTARDGNYNGLWQISHGYRSLINNWTQNTSNVDDEWFIYRHTPEDISYPSLAALPVYEKNENWESNRRILINNAQGDTVIRSSIEGFLHKKADVNYTDIPLYGFRERKGKEVAFSGLSIERNDKESNIGINILDPKFKNESVYFVSDLFEIKDDDILTYHLALKGNKEGNVYLVDEQNHMLELPKDFDPYLYNRFKLKFINSSNKVYRLVFETSKTESTYFEKLILDAEPHILYKSNDGGGIFKEYEYDLEERESNIVVPNIYPNPNNGEMTLELPFFREGESLILSVYDLKGSEVYRKEITDSSSNHILDYLTSGNYLVSVKSSDGLSRYGSIQFTIDK